MDRDIEREAFDPHTATYANSEPDPLIIEQEAEMHRAMVDEIGEIRYLAMMLGGVPRTAEDDQAPTGGEDAEASPHAPGADVTAQIIDRLSALEERMAQLSPRPARQPATRVPWAKSQNLLAAWIGLSYEAFMSQTEDPRRVAIDKKRATGLICSVFEVQDKAGWKEPSGDTVYRKPMEGQNPERVVEMMQRALDDTRTRSDGNR